MFVLQSTNDLRYLFFVDELNEFLHQLIDRWTRIDATDANKRQKKHDLR